jgi:fumarate reductase subunit D
MPSLVIVVGFLLAFGVGGADAEASYQALSHPLTHPVISALVFAALGVVLWHCCHRAYHMLHDLQIEPPEIVRAVTYGLAILIPVAAWIITVSG